MGRRAAHKPPATGKLRRDLLIAIGLTAMTWAVYWPACQFDFVDLDDNSYVFWNRDVKQGLSLESLRWALTARTVANWQPVMSFSLMLDATLFGDKAGGFHFTNVVLHTANTLLLFVLLKRMTGAVWNSAFVAALFAIHPLHVESVAWISERKDVLSTLFVLLAVLAYCRYARTGGWKPYTAALATFVLSLASKPMFVTLPFLLLLFDGWPLKRTRWISPDDAAGKVEPHPVEARGKKTVAAANDRQDAAMPTPVPIKRLLLEKVPFFLIAFVFCYVAYATQTSGNGVIPLDTISLPVRIANAVLVYALYILKAFWPTRLAVFYPHPGHSISPTAVTAAALFLIAVTSFVLVQWRRRPYLLVGWFWYLGTLIPVIGLVQIGLQQMADRYTYFPLIGFFIALTWFVSSLLPDRPRQQIWLWGVVLVPLVACLVLARQQLFTWQNSVTLFRHALAVTENDDHVAAADTGGALAPKDDFRMHFHHLLGLALDTRQRREEAIQEFQKSLAINPRFANAHADLGVSLYSLDRVKEAVSHFEEAIALDPDLAGTHVNLGVALFRLGQPQEGFAHLKQAVALDPSNVNAHINMGNALEFHRQYDEALDHFRQAAELDPANWLPHYMLGVRLHARGDLEMAEREYRLAIRLKPDVADAYSNLGTLLLQRRNRRDAIIFFRKALELNPQDSQARQQLERLGTQ